MEYKEIEEFQKIREKDPFHLFFLDTFRKETCDEEEKFKETFIKNVNDFNENPCPFNLVELHNRVLENSAFSYGEFFLTPFLQKIVSFLNDETMTQDNTKVVLDFVVSILELPGNEFGYRLCDLKLIDVLEKLVYKERDLWVPIVSCLALVQSKNYDSYNERIMKELFKPIMKSLSEALTIESTQASLLFIFSVCRYQNLEEKRIKQITEQLAFAILLPDYRCTFYALSSLKAIASRFPNFMDYLSTTRITMGIAVLIPDPPFNGEENISIISAILDVYELMFKTDGTHLFIFPVANIFPRLIELAGGANIGVANRTLEVICSAITHFYGAAVSFLEFGLMELLSSIINESPLKIKDAAFVVFCQLLKVCDPETTKKILNDANIEPVFSMIHEFAGPHFLEFAESLTAAIGKCDQEGAGDEARQMLIDLDIPTMISDVIEEVEETDEAEKISFAANNLIKLIAPDDDDGD